MLWSLLFVGTVLSNGFPDYTPYSYPDSRTQSELCGQQRPSFFCDPNNVVWRGAENQTEASELLNELESIRVETNCSCKYINQCYQIHRGYTVSIAVVEKMHLDQNETSREVVLEAARIFADTIRDRQNRAQCDDDVLIFLSVRDEVVWTSIGEGVAIDDSDVRRIAEQGEILFRKMKYKEGLTWMVQQYKHVLKQEKLDRFWSWPLPKWAMITIGIVILVILSTLIITAIYVAISCCRKSHKDIYSVIDQHQL
ncbi:unnamed protein product [Caenorhabditis angaria]|uniref:Uncharacterized protein n=1 Tax=Caenorhabditis angaria TaxID=860376 RepID=A0A9P1IWD4_9PELO|nr:unnamed protein product [Caenorhabditis angaria]